MVLFIDDDELTLRALRRVFERDGVAARDLATGRAIAAQLQPEAILIDVEIDNGEGLAAVPSILRASPGSRLIVFTSTVTGEGRRLALGAGASAYVHKIHITRIDEIVEDVLASARDVAKVRAVLH